MSNGWNHYIHINCRTCAWSTAKDDGTWRCERHDADDIPVEFQRTGCEDHALHDDLVPWPTIPDDDVQVFNINGHHVKNGRKSEHVFASAELIANPDLCTKGGQFVTEMRTKIDGEISNAI